MPESKPRRTHSAKETILLGGEPVSSPCPSSLDGHSRPSSLLSSIRHTSNPQTTEKSTENLGSKNKRSYIHWTVQMDTALSNILLEQHSMGHKTPNGWKSMAFTAAILTLKDICNVDINKEKITARLKTWNKYYHEVSAMLDTSGFEWDWERNMIKVDSEEVWENYVKAHPGMKHYKGKVIINWSYLGVLCGNDKATDIHATTGIHAATATEDVNELDSVSIAEESYTLRDNSRFVGEGSTRPRKKRVTGIDALAEAISSMANSIDKSLNTDNTNDADKSLAHAQAIYATLAKLHELNQREILKAMDMLSRNTTKFGVFMALPDEMKTTWLRMQFYE